MSSEACGTHAILFLAWVDYPETISIVCFLCGFENTTVYVKTGLPAAKWSMVEGFLEGSMVNGSIARRFKNKVCGLGFRVSVCRPYQQLMAGGAVLLKVVRLGIPYKALRQFLNPSPNTRFRNPKP